MKLLVVNNSSAGPGDGAIYDFIRMIMEDGDEVCLRCTDGTTDAACLLEGASNFDAVVAAGGDGTVTRIAYALANSGIPILPFPSGTANLIANNLMLPFEPPALAKLVRTMRTLDFDLGEMEVQGKRFGFGVMAGAGFDAAIMSAAEPSKKALGPIAYFSAAVANITPQNSHFVIDIDGETIERDGVGVLLVNFSKIQLEVTVTHDNEPRDGEFDVVVLRAHNAFELVPAIIAGLLDRDGGFPSRTDSLEILKGRNVHVVADPPLEVQFDGETPHYETPFSARIIDSAARFIVSDAGFEQFARKDD